MSEEKRKLFNPLYSDIAYDDAFRMIESNCDDILIDFVNFIFGENYDKTAVITRMRNEHFVENENHSKEKRITDSHFSITQNGIDKKYHLECESGTYDGTILVRLFEYDAMIAADLAEGDERTIRVKFPLTGLLLLRESKKAPDKAEIIIETPEGSTSYHVNIIRESDFSIEAIFDERLYFLIPFYIFNYEKELKDIDNDEKRLEELAKMYNDILKKLEDELRCGRLQDSSYSVIITVTHSVFYKLTMNHPNVQEKVGDIMGGKDLELPEVMFYKRGLEEGEAERKALLEENEKLRKEIEELKKKQLVND
ncbi:hypothetical protein SAMN04487760_1177 [Lachnospiraceae bacterium G41]|nr:hypothetical protein SAMN04487760_1177 [Lachnospiraceae bacterium G41]